MFQVRSFFKRLINNRNNTTSQIESLRIKITKNKVKDICAQRYKKEENNPQGYDIKASCCAIGHFKLLALEIEASTATSYMKVLNKRVEHAQNNCAFAGEYSGGIGTYGALNSALITWYEEELRHYSPAELMTIANSIQ